MQPIPYGRQFIDDDDINAVVEALRSDWLTQGPKIVEFERAIAEYCGARHAVAFANGTAALHGAYYAAGVGPGNEIITSANTFLATANAAVMLGAEARFGDIDSRSFNLEPASAASLIGNRTRAIVPVHFAGLPCDMKAFAALAAKHQLAVIEDACHAIGATYDGQRIGACQYSDMVCFSFHPVKQMTTGEGGMVLTNDARYDEKLRLFRSHGMTRDPKVLEQPDVGGWYYEMIDLGFNYRITDIQAALGLSQLRKLPQFVARRRQIAARYDEAFASRDDVVPQGKTEGAESSCHLYVVRFTKTDRRRMYDSLRELGILTQVHYIPVHLQPYYRQRGGRVGAAPRAESYYSQCLSLPLFPAMTDGDVERVIESVLKCLST